MTITSTVFSVLENSLLYFFSSWIVRSITEAERRGWNKSYQLCTKTRTTGSFFFYDWQLFENGNLAIEKNDPPVGDEDVDTVCAVLRKHLVLEVLHPEHLFTLRCGIHASQGIDQGAFPNILSE